MIGRFTHLFKKRAEKSAMRKKAEAMFSSKEEVNINGNGTSGYVVKEGINKDNLLLLFPARSAGKIFYLENP